MSKEIGNKNEKMLVIGIDGGTFEAIGPLAAQGDLPVLASLMGNGVWGDLESTVPPDTGPAWVSMMTGVNPGKHGVFFFLDSLHDNLRFGKSLGSGDIEFPPLWTVLSKNNKRVFFMNVPFTYPPSDVNGCLVSGMLIPDSAEVVSYPPELHSELETLLDGFSINDWSPDIICSDKSKFHLHNEKIVKVLSSVTEKRKQATLHVMRKDPWEFGMVVFTAIDRLQHLFWEYHGRQDSSGLNGLIRDGYQQIDKAIGEIIKEAGENTTVLITSDHGFGPIKKYFYVNKWLEEIGLLHLKKGVNTSTLGFNMTSLKRIINRIAPSVQAPKWTEHIRVPRLRSVQREATALIDWERTKAYGDPSGGINVNLAGREPLGTIPQGPEYESTLRFIQEQFLLIRDESGARPIADWILRKEEIYSGPFVQDAADLYYSLGERSYLHNTNVDGNEIIGDCSLGTGMHRKNGILIMNGPRCRKSVEIRPRIIDIAPTVLYLMGLPVVDEMDGKVLEEGILSEHLNAHPVAVAPAEMFGIKKGTFSDEDEEKIQESLKALGYL